MKNTIIRVKAGLGNQMFQYAFARLLQENYGIENVLLDFSYYKSLTTKMTMIYDLNTKISKATQSEISNICKLQHTQKPHSFAYRFGIFIEKEINSQYFYEPNRGYINPEEIMNYSYFDGYWQSWRYVQPVVELLKRELTINIKNDEKYNLLLQNIKRQNSVFLGCRRGDYINKKSLQHHYVADYEYYKKAIEFCDNIFSNPIFYVFTNDTQWVKENIHTENELIIVDRTFGFSDIEENMLMRSTKGAIIPCSTFHWWGAMLNEHKDAVIIRPEHWFIDGSPIDIFPPSWKVL